jgi:hypothetical protein
VYYLSSEKLLRRKYGKHSADNAEKHIQHCGYTRAFCEQIAAFESERRKRRKAAADSRFQKERGFGVDGIFQGKRSYRADYERAKDIYTKCFYGKVGGGVQGDKSYQVSENSSDESACSYN